MKTLEINSDDRILIIAPHPDDEIIGCGSILVQYGRQCDVLLLTDGAKGHRIWSESRTRRIRKREFEQVMNLCNVMDYSSKGIRDRELKKVFDCYQGFGFSKYNMVFVPNRKEDHPDHKASFYQLLIHHIFHHIRADIYQYEVWTPIDNPTHMIDISNTIEKKVDVLGIYESQIKEFDYINAVYDLNGKRGQMNNVAYAECYRKGFL
ncbi:PIG-L deacetylase family protein [Butyrivibrio sp. TB]|jgi:LmbE family N-acetylglucosaminyl deacetylase|uniref:PIG-L deacetylase family protein n=1 Tax=Butyrivibrio sp. TB TaxID=1520809 RepID=UPI0008CF3CED|nr:PIG-L family deacetylase [Butyrivibrio sp. TB]SEQ15263.1 N-acetylglucosaminyl deacetylase, LmbE family [Butyrivibrio sp. TB]